VPVDIHTIESRYLRASRRITVLAPQYRGGHIHPAPVLYLNDGQNLFEPSRAFAGRTWRVAETVKCLVDERIVPPLMVVGIDHGGMLRAREYLPVADARNPHARRPLGSRYAEFVTREVVPFIEATYGVSRRVSMRAFGGSSYGAIAALLTVLQRPGFFGRLLIESPSLYVGGRILLRKARRARRWPARVYLGVGTAETPREEINRETVENVRVLESILKEAGLGPKRLKALITEGATHSEDAWADRLPQALTFLFGTADGSLSTFARADSSNGP
jgi:predicted alpha/beta superfamily hydrolase